MQKLSEEWITDLVLKARENDRWQPPGNGKDLDIWMQRMQYMLDQQQDWDDFPLELNPLEFIAIVAKLTQEGIVLTPEVIYQVMLAIVERDRDRAIRTDWEDQIPVLVYVWITGTGKPDWAGDKFNNGATIASTLLVTALFKYNEPPTSSEFAEILFTMVKEEYSEHMDDADLEMISGMLSYATRVARLYTVPGSEVFALLREFRQMLPD